MKLKINADPKDLPFLKEPARWNRGSHQCACGKTISANRKVCKACSEKPAEPTVV